MQKWKAILLVAAILVQSFYCPVMAREARFLETAAPVLDLSAKSAVAVSYTHLLILELKDKLRFEELEEDGVGAEIFDTSVDSSDSVMITIEGLVSLGYSKSEAAIAVNKVEDAKDLTPEELLKKALKNIMI